MICPPDREEGVSVIVGTLLLILITVIAAAGLAVMVSEFQKKEMQRQSLQEATENENLKILKISPECALADWQAIYPSMNETGNWSAISFDIYNANVDHTRITAVTVNSRYPLRYQWDGILYNTTGDPKGWPIIGATKTAMIRINMTDGFSSPYNISQGETVKVRVFTSHTNVFERTFQAPTPIARYSIESEDIGVGKREYILLDGSGSFDDGDIQDWTWTVMATNQSSPINWSDKTTVTEKEYRGKIVPLRFESSGPFRILLTVTDDTGMFNTAGPIDIPKKRAFDPPAYLDVSFEDSTDTVTATVTDLFGNPVEEVYVTFITIDGSLSVTPTRAQTGSDGTAKCTATGSGNLRVLSGDLPQKDLYIE
ncbi:MAG TPA: type IV pilin [Methanofollis liminatans]|uniref:Type IV pilin n=1 Tax=Methanofollis liminatans TaxID=2201 RepID=A0A831LWG2_9EURY|nr:type IV pilin [Methanofollis liminatans]